eukprot:CAMPEP_0184646926 /NCGR_PEP_ID=MMETSP0308-20130426/3746_1 /TAXON_ID=38269 /ORGANISM="Gloeochaete witrockiana, Strain SAG 46.84" /LENGTH=122 /DNA_ID=CAMNT_0027077417 /DNA_START=437 /DNA_END=805 /DNA_ORIENTATION=-
MQKLREREEDAIREAKKNASRLGVGVTQEAQDIYDGLAKTMPVKWEEQTIIVFEDTKIVAPFTMDEVSGTNEKAVAHVKKVLDNTLRKLRKSQAPSSSSSSSSSSQPSSFQPIPTSSSGPSF